MRPLFHTSTSRPVSRQLVSLWKINIKKRMTCKACKTTTISARVSIKASRKTGETHEPPSKRAHHVFTATLMFMALTSAGRRIRQALPSSRRKPSLARPRPVPAAVGTADGPGTRLAPMQFRARNQSIGKQGAGRAGGRPASPPCDSRGSRAAFESAYGRLSASTFFFVLLSNFTVTRKTAPVNGRRRWPGDASIRALIFAASTGRSAGAHQ